MDAGVEFIIYCGLIAGVGVICRYVIEKYL